MLGSSGALGPDDNQALGELTGATMIAFLGVAAVARLAVKLGW